MLKRLLLVAIVAALSIGCRCNSECKAKPASTDQPVKQASEPAQ